MERNWNGGGGRVRRTSGPMKRVKAKAVNDRQSKRERRKRRGKDEEADPRFFPGALFNE